MDHEKQRLSIEAYQIILSKRLQSARYRGQTRGFASYGIAVTAGRQGTGIRADQYCGPDGGYGRARRAGEEEVRTGYRVSLLFAVK